MTDSRTLSLIPGLFAALFLAGSVGTGASGQTVPEVQDVVSGRMALQHIEALAGDIGSRPAGSPNEHAAAAYIETVLREAGYEPAIQSFSVSGRASRRESGNVVAVKAGRSSREIIVGAHYDSEMRGSGADDNASGVGILLEVAVALGKQVPPYTVRFVAFGSEERGFQGARHFVSTMTPRSIANTVAMINLDSLTAGDMAYVYGSEGDTGRIRDWVLEQAAERGMDLRTQDGLNPEYPPGTTCACSDHTPFDDAGIEYVYFESTNWMLGDLDGYTQVDPSFGEDGYIWHTPYDTLAYLNTNFPGRVEARLALFARMLYTVLTEYNE